MPHGPRGTHPAFLPGLTLTQKCLEAFSARESDAKSLRDIPEKDVCVKGTMRALVKLSKRKECRLAARRNSGWICAESKCVKDSSFSAIDDVNHIRRWQTVPFL